MVDRDRMPRIDRRQFLALGGGVALAGALTESHRWAWLVGDPRQSSGLPRGSTLHRVDTVPTGVTRTWLAPELWANRLADWRLNQGTIECLTSHARGGIRTVSLITEEMAPGVSTCRLTARTGTLAGGRGFSGFLVGAGGGRLDYRAAALVHGVSGLGGGFLCLYESDGHVRFRSHTNEVAPTDVPVLPSVEAPAPNPARSLGENVLLTLDVVPSPAGGTFDVTLTARDLKKNVLVAKATRFGVPDAELWGGVSLVSGPTPGAAGARYWFADLWASGPKLLTDPSRALGPILGTLYSLSSGVLKLQAHVAPISAADPQTLLLQFQGPGGTWVDGPTAVVDSMGVAAFRVTGWDSTTAWPYRVVYGPGTTSQSTYAGTVAAEPDGTRPLTIATVNCTRHSYRSLDQTQRYSPALPGERYLGVFTPESLYFPYADVVSSIQAQAPDLLAALGDQYYEQYPTVEEPPPAPYLDMRYRWYLWLWSFRALTAVMPTIVLVDDHDVYQGNLWGHAGAPTKDFNLGGYVMAPAFVNSLQHIQCGHNPDPYDPTPVLQGIDVYYGTFHYGGTSFVMLEDRKFKMGNLTGVDPATGQPFPPASLQLLGLRQEQLLSAWRTMDPGMPKVALTQTLWGALMTLPDGHGQHDTDSDGYPPANRRTALSLIKQAKAVLLAGDQHLGSLVRHGLATFKDGPVQFTAPAAGSAFQRWFEPRPLPNPEATPHTGDFTDRFGNKMHVLAVANPKVTLAAFAAVHPPGFRMLGDRKLKKDGYGVLRVDYAQKAFVFEAWAFDADPTRDLPYPGWPYRLPFAAA